MSKGFAMAELTHGETNAFVKLAGGAEAVRAVLRGDRTLKVEVKNGGSNTVIANLLEEVRQSVKLPAIERFIAREKFKVDCNGELPISFLSDNFRTNLLGVVEEGVEAATLRQRKLLKSSTNDPILCALGGKDKARVALAHVFDYLKTADRTQWYIFYVADVKGVPWAVFAGWFSDDGGWSVEARSVSYPIGWDDGRQVVSR